MKRGLVSVIIAVYNAEQYLPHCLDSIISQTHKNLEIIIINDASTDKTQQIIEEYHSKDARILPLMMDRNSGAPAARNKGMAVSKGEFMTMVDADDALSADAIELALKDMQQDDEIDMVLYNVDIVDDKGNATPYNLNPKVPTVMTGKEACYWSMRWDMPGWGVSRSPLEQSMPAETAYGQYGDETTTHLVFLKARKVKLGKGKYFYYQAPTSYTHSVSMKRFEILECRISLRNHLIEQGVGERILRRLETRRWQEFIRICHFYFYNKSYFSATQRDSIMQRLADAYDTFSWRNLPLTTVVKPRFMLFPWFKLFYMQIYLVFKLKLFRL